MNALERLVAEHALILRATGAISQLLDSSRGELSPEPFFALHRFIRRCLDGAHHAKEEQVLFPALIAAGLPGDVGPVHVMLEEHREERRDSAALLAAAQAVAAGRPGAQERMIAAATDYCQFIVEHIDEENDVLFPMAAEVLEASGVAALTERFEAADPLELDAFEQLANAVVEAAQLAGRKRASGE